MPGLSLGLGLGLNRKKGGGVRTTPLNVLSSAGASIAMLVLKSDGTPTPACSRKVA